MARCSRKDNYNKKRGIQIAFGRAIKNSMSPDVPVIKEDKIYVEVVREIAEKIKDTVSESHRPSSVHWNEL